MSHKVLKGRTEIITNQSLVSLKIIVKKHTNHAFVSCFNLISAIRVTHQNPNLDSLMCELFPILQYFLLCN